MINIDLENSQENIQVEGEIPCLLTELSFVIAFIYSNLFLIGVDEKESYALIK